MRELTLFEFNETTGLDRVADLESLLNPGTQRAQLRLTEAIVSQPFLARSLETMSGGQFRPEWCHPQQPVAAGEVNLFKIQDAIYLPSIGTLITQEGGVCSRSYGEAKFIYGDKFQIPGSRSNSRSTTFSVSPNLPCLEDAIVFAPWGALHNYGHFLLDALPTLSVLGSLNVRKWNVVAPKLNRWQRDLTNFFADGGGITLSELESSAYLIKNAFFFDIMDHFLHRSNHLLKQIGSDVRSKVAKTADPHFDRIVITRKKNKKRVCVNESAIIEGLMARNFVAVAPEEHTVEDQVKIFSSARCVVGASGAALANVIFCLPGTRLIEIQADLALNIWIMNLCCNVSAEWFPFFVKANPAKDAVILAGIERPEIGITFEVDLDAFFPWVDKVLEGAE